MLVACRADANRLMPAGPSENFTSSSSVPCTRFCPASDGIHFICVIPPLAVSRTSVSEDCSRTLPRAARSPLDLPLHHTSLRCRPVAAGTPRGKGGERGRHGRQRLDRRRGCQSAEPRRSTEFNSRRLLLDTAVVVIQQPLDVGRRGAASDVRQQRGPAVGRAPAFSPTVRGGDRSSQDQHSWRKHRGLVKSHTDPTTDGARRGCQLADARVLAGSAITWVVGRPLAGRRRRPIGKQWWPQQQSIPQSLLGQTPMMASS